MLKDQEGLIKGQVAEGKEPLEVRIKQIDYQGFVHLTFTKSLNLPDNFIEMVEAS